MADEAMNGGNFSHDNTAAPTAHRVLPLFSLTGRTAIVSGAGAGIGLAVAEALAEAGANVAIWYNSNKKAIEEAEKIEKEYGVKCTCIPPLLQSSHLIGAHILTLVGGSGRAYQVDVTSYEVISAITEQVVREFNGRLDVFVANSGIPWTQGAALDGELDHYHKIMKTDIDSAFYCARVAG